jgi:hypothetical protein
VAYLPDNVNDLVVRDFNADGFQDAAVINYTDHRVFVLLGNGDGTLKHTSTLSTGLDPIDMASGDFNNDGAFDFAVANQGSDSFSVFLGNGNGTFKPKVDYSSGGDYANGIAVADLDQDGLPEIIVANSRSNNIGVFKALGDGTFQSLYTVRVRKGPTGVSVGDYNRDGLSDISVSCQGPFPYPAAVTVLLNTGNGFLAAHSVLPSPKTSHLVSGHLNADGFPEVIATHGAEDARLTDFLNDAVWSFPISPMNPSTQPFSAFHDYRGANFSLYPSRP